ncbi:MAG: helicase-related protein [Verrucomicrobiota bacterium]|jgi:superfamily II DNA or RNA helicase
MTDVPRDYAEVVRKKRRARGWTQAELAERLGLTNVTISRWEGGKVEPLPMFWQKFLEVTGSETRSPGAARKAAVPEVVDFMGDGLAVRAMVEGERLAFGHLANPAFATEISKIDPLPHQRLAVYDHMLNQPRLRFLLADDAGAGKTIMTGLYIREMLARRLIRRILVVPPAGLVGNWQSEMRELFGLEFDVVVGADLSSRTTNPFSTGPNADRVICSVDTLDREKAFLRLSEEGVLPYDLVVFDEAHKLSARQDADLTIRRSARYELAEALAGVANRKAEWKLGWSARHLLLLTATPHMGKDYPFFALWKLLDPQTFSTIDAFQAMPRESRERFFIRRTKEEMVTFEGKPLYPERNTDTFSYDLTQGPVSEQTLYDQTTEYLRHIYNRAKMLNKTAAQLALGVFQRRMASSTFALLRSLERRLARLEGVIEDVVAGRIDLVKLARQAERLRDEDDPFDAHTADEEAGGEGEEENERSEEEILGSFVATTIADLEIEKDYVSKLLVLARKVQDLGHESKFERLKGIIEDKRFRNEKLLVFTEHRDTLTYLRSRLDGLGFTGQVASIHGGMNYLERGEQVAFFKRPIEDGGARIMVCTDAAGEGINLQFCWVMVNYDIPWNPARLEQRMGRIHRYGQPAPEVFILNLIAGKTREGKVVKVLLDKLEAIRKELKSEKVFDVIGRIFEGKSITDYMRRSLEGEDLDQLTLDLGGQLTKEQVAAIAERERRIYGDGGDVAIRLPGLKEKMAAEVYSQLLPGYVRQFVQDAGPMLHLRLAAVDEKRFRLTATRPRALDPLLPMLEAKGRDQLEITFSRPPRGENGAVWVHPGEPVFDELRGLVNLGAMSHARRGAVVVDPSSTHSYLLHLASVTILRRADPSLAALKGDEVLEQCLVALRQHEDGTMTVRPIEEFLLLEPRTGGLPLDAQRLAVSAQGRIEEARAFMVATVAKEFTQKHRDRLNADLASRVEFLRQGFFYEQKELVEARTVWSKRRREGHPSAEREIERIRDLQRAWERRSQDAEQTVLREPALIGVGPVDFLAHVLVRPAANDEESMRYDAEVERVAMELVMAHERALGARVQDVHSPELSLQAGLNTPWPGFDVLSHRPEGKRRCIEVKGSARQGNIHISTNEWAAAANRREEYWLYAVFDCGSAAPRLVAVQDPFAKLVEKAAGFELKANDILAAGEHLA